MHDDTVSRNPGFLTTNPQLGHIQRLIEAEKYDHAAQSLVEYLRKSPKDPRALAKLGFVAMRLGALEQARQFLQQAIAGGMSDFETRRNLASVLSQQDRPEQAIPMFEQLTREREEPGLKAVLAGLLEKVGRSDDSRDLYRQLTRDNPANPALWVVIARGQPAMLRKRSTPIAKLSLRTTDMVMHGGRWQVSSARYWTKTTSRPCARRWRLPSIHAI